MKNINFTFSAFIFNNIYLIIKSKTMNISDKHEDIDKAHVNWAQAFRDQWAIMFISCILNLVCKKAHQRESCSLENHDTVLESKQVIGLHSIIAVAHTSHPPGFQQKSKLIRCFVLSLLTIKRSKYFHRQLYKTINPNQFYFLFLPLLLHRHSHILAQQEKTIKTHNP